MKAAIYARCSTDDKEQDPQTQIKPCLEYCKQHGYSMVKTYTDICSGRQDEQHRPQLVALLSDAAHRKFDAVVIWKMDRLSRLGIRHVFSLLEKFKLFKVQVISVTEPYLSTDNPASELILAVLSWAAEYESKMTGQRVKAGIERVKAEGGTWGRKKAQFDLEKAMEMHSKGVPMLTIAQSLGVGYGTIHRALKACRHNRGVMEG